MITHVFICDHLWSLIYSSIIMSVLTDIISYHQCIPITVNMNVNIVHKHFKVYLHFYILLQFYVCKTILQCTYVMNSIPWELLINIYLNLNLNLIFIGDHQWSSVYSSVIISVLISDHSCTQQWSPVYSAVITSVLKTRDLKVFIRPIKFTMLI